MIVPALSRGIAASVFLTATALCASPVVAQSSMLQEKIAEAKQLMQVNRQQLARYTWQMQETVSVSGDVKTQNVYQVTIGSDGQQVKTMIAQPVAPQTGGRQHGIKHRMKEDFQQYAQDVAALVKNYSPLDPARIQQLYAQGAVSMRSGGAPGYSSIVIASYFKPGDKVVLTLSDNPKALYSVNVSSYLSQPSDAVTVSVSYATLPDGTHHSSTTTVNGQSKNLKVVDQTMNYTLRTQ